MVKDKVPNRGKMWLDRKTGKTYCIDLDKRNRGIWYMVKYFLYIWILLLLIAWLNLKKDNETVNKKISQNWAIRDIATELVPTQCRESK